MNDLRPSEDINPTFPEMRRRGFFKDLATGAEFFTEPAAGESDPVEALIEQAVNAHSPEQGAVYAQIAAVRAIQAQTEQLRIGNIIALATLARAEFAGYAGEAGGMGTLFSYPAEENGNIQIRDDIRAELGL